MKNSNKSFDFYDITFYVFNKLKRFMFIGGLILSIEAVHRDLSYWYIMLGILLVFMGLEFMIEFNHSGVRDQNDILKEYIDDGFKDLSDRIVEQEKYLREEMTESIEEVKDAIEKIG